jgi:Xaa-Pro aminopeptidase
MTDSVTRMNALLDASGLDAVVASSMENVFYLTGAWIDTQKAIPDRLALVVWPRSGTPTLIVCTIEESLARRDSRIGDIRGYIEFQTSPIEALADVLQENKLTGARIGFERNHIVARYHDELREALPRVAWKGADRLFDEVRMLKSEAELAKLARAAHITDGVIWDAFQRARAGRPEKEIGDWMQMELMARGSDGGILLVMGAGDAAGLAHPYPRPRPLAGGDVVRVDFVGVFAGYLADLARTMVVGEATALQRDNYARLWDVQQATIAALRPGVRASAIYDLCAGSARKAGLDFNMPHIGHGLGVGLHEHPMISPRNDTLLAEGMAIAIEPVCGNPDGSKFHIEDLIIIRRSGPEIVSRAGQWQSLFVSH